MYTRGFTLFELLITLVIISLLMTVGIPSFSAQLKSSKLDATAQALFDAVAFTRSQAVFGNTRVTLRNNDSWENGWKIFVDSNDNGLHDDDEKLLLVREKTSSVRIHANRPLQHYISFISTGESRYVGRANGGAFQAGTVNICTLGTGSGYTLVLSRSGRMRMNKISSEECAAH